MPLKTELKIKRDRIKTEAVKSEIGLKKLKNKK